MERKSIVVRRAASEEVIDLRHNVLRWGLARETAIFAGDDDIMSVHLVAQTDRRVVGCVTLHRKAWEGEPAWQLRGMAVAQDVRGCGVGTLLLEAAEQAVRDDLSPALIWCNARVAAVEFYRKRGWRVVSQEFVVPTAGPHRKMLKRLEPHVR